MPIEPASYAAGMPRRTLLVGAAALPALLGAPRVAQPQSFREAPLLAEAVRAGRLPPVEQRMPREPLVVTPLEEVGRHGGAWRMALRGGSDNLPDRTIGYTRLARWNPQWTAVVPDVASAIEASPDATEFVFTLREGHRWSDGTPFTSEDILFWYRDVLMDRAVTQAIPSWLVAGGRPVVVEADGPTRVRFRFAASNGTFLLNMATMLGSDVLAGAPAHWLRRFHKRHSEDADRLAQEARASSWAALVQAKVVSASRWRDATRPVLDAWKLINAYAGASQVVAERNPYFHKVDPAGNQLPYLDRVVFDVVEDRQTVVLKAINGEIDMENRFVEEIDVRPVIVENRQRGGYRLYRAPPAWSNAMLINLNQTSKNPGLRALFRRKDFRIGLSHGINRDELNQLVHAGQGPAYQAAPLPGTRLYDEQMATQYTRFSRDLANRHLDAAGLTRRDRDGVRLDAEGRRASFAIDVLSDQRQHIDTLELIRGHWRRIGIDMQVRPLERSFVFARLQANDHDANVWLGGGGYDMLGLLDPKWYLPFDHESSYASAWGIWNQSPEAPNAEEPPDWAKQQQLLHRRMQSLPTIEAQLDVMREILAITREQFPVIGTNRAPMLYGIVRTTLRNVPEEIPNTLFYMTPGPASAETWFYGTARG